MSRFSIKKLKPIGTYKKFDTLKEMRDYIKKEERKYKKKYGFQMRNK